VFSVPSGAFGNGVAATIASQMGLPVKTIIIANNDNDTLARLFQTGKKAINNKSK
jgi:threonine synthase